jgi:hypothetical protein
MAFKPNYNQQRAERNRLKQAKREEKLRLQQERTAQRKSVTGGASEEASGDGLPEGGEPAAERDNGEREGPGTGS